MRFRSIAAALLATVALPFALPAQAANIEVVHWWTSGGEQAAVSVFAKEFDALGSDKWVDTGIAGGPNARAAVMQRILGGDPPQAAQFNISRQFEDLISGGQLLDLTDLAEKEGWRKFIRPKSILDVCEKDGHIYCVPVNIHSWQWAWASTEAFKKAGAPIPTTIEDFLAAAPKLKAAGYIPFAIGGEKWQQAGAFNVLLLGMNGPDLFYKVYKAKDPAAAASPEVKKVFETLRTLKQYSDPGVAGRNWNDTTNLIITNKAGMQIMGDWARGEFALAGKKPGTDYECIPGPAPKPYLQVGGDVFIFPKQKDPSLEAAQLKLAKMLVDPVVQAKFNLAKGSLPVRDDVDLSLADSCMKKGLGILKDPSSVVENSEIFVSADTQGQIEDLISEFWANDSLTPEAAQKRYVDIMSSAK